MAGQRHQHLGHRQRRVQEESQPVGDTLPPQRLGEGDEMIVMHPDVVVGPQQGLQRVGEPLIDREIAGQRLPLVVDQPDPIMQ